MFRLRKDTSLVGKREQMTTLDKIILADVGFIIGFTLVNLIIFCIFQSVPDTLIECFFGVAGGECVITFMIWWIKKKYGKEKTNGKTEKS